MLCIGGLLAGLAAADVVCLKDGSILRGEVLPGPEGELVLSSPQLGEVAIPQDAVLARLPSDAGTETDSYVILVEGLDVLACLTRTVPARQEGKEAFTLLVPGQVVAVADANGVELGFHARSLADNSLVTVAYDTLDPETEVVSVTTLQQGRVRPTEEGLLRLRLNYIPDQDRRLRVIVAYPDGFQPRQISPAATRRTRGLIIWEKDLRRQQRFEPEIRFVP